MSLFSLVWRRHTLRSILLIAVLFACGRSSLVASAEDDRLVGNPNQAPAGRRSQGQLTIQLEAAVGDWRPEADAGPKLRVAAFREAEGALSTPGPLLRVTEGTEIHAVVYNRLDGPLTVHGLHSRPGDAKEVLVVAPGESREVRFLAGAPGTYFYWGSRNGAETLVQRRAEDSQLNGALIIDPKSDGTKAQADRILVITNWLSLDNDQTRPLLSHEVLGINGLSWPYTERLIYRVGETAHWRVINASSVNHPMHLHGFYFRVDSVGDAESDTVYNDDQRRMAVTELVRPGRTFTLTWTPDRSGNWVFHCHVLPHISPDRGFRRQTSTRSDHHSADHARESMAGLVTGITVLPADGRVDAPQKLRVPPRRMELVAAELPNVFGKEPGMAFAIKRPGAPLQPTIPGPPIVLTQGEPAAIRVVNRLAEPLAVHWHGIELESYFDGVAGISGFGRRLLPAIAPGKSFVARFTPPRAGTFIYHTHMDDVNQLSSGLYGPLIVLRPVEHFDPESDRVLVISKAGTGLKPIWLNGSQSPEISSFKVGHTYRLRIINITPENPPIDVSLKIGGTAATWRPIAKDGADLPGGQRELRPAQVTVSVGETYDFEFQPEHPGSLALELVRPAIRLPAQITPSRQVVEARSESRIAVNVAVQE